jgi:hypothetical protein
MIEEAIMTGKSAMQPHLKPYKYVRRCLALDKNVREKRVLFRIGWGRPLPDAEKC